MKFVHCFDHEVLKTIFEGWYVQNFWYVIHVEIFVEILPKKGNLEIGNFELASRGSRE